MNVLGISGGVRLGNWDSAAALIMDGRIIAAAEEERFTRVKHAPGALPTNAIRYCLDEGRIDIRDIDVVVFPGRTYRNMRDRLQTTLISPTVMHPRLNSAIIMKRMRLPPTTRAGFRMPSLSRSTTAVTAVPLRFRARSATGSNCLRLGNTRNPSVCSMR